MKSRKNDFIVLIAAYYRQIPFTYRCGVFRIQSNIYDVASSQKHLMVDSQKRFYQMSSIIEASQGSRHTSEMYSHLL